MNKVVCDICGSAFQETADQCPICGSAKQLTNKSVSQAGVRTPTKGGHFSNANVRKRIQANQTRSGKRNGPPAKKPGKQQSNRGLMIVAFLLLLAITVALVFILIHYVTPLFGKDSGKQTDPQITQTTPVETTPSTQPVETLGVPCTGITLDSNEVALDAVGREWLLSLTVQPENTTDTVTFSSSDPSVATVTDKGRITAVSKGEAVITITCGSITQQCRVVCNIPGSVPETTEALLTDPTTEPTTEPTEAPTEAPTEPPILASQIIDRDNILFTVQGGFYEFDTGDIPVSDIEWRSGNTDIAYFGEDGVLTAAAPGTTTVYATYQGVTAECVVTCSFSAYAVYPSTDVTIKVNESFDLYLLDADGNPVSATWTAVTPSWALTPGGVTISGDTITGAATGDLELVCEVDGHSYSCIVRVSGILQ